MLPIPFICFYVCLRFYCTTIIYISLLHLCIPPFHCVVVDVCFAFLLHHYTSIYYPHLYPLNSPTLRLTSHHPKSRLQLLEWWRSACLKCWSCTVACPVLGRESTWNSSCPWEDHTSARTGHFDCRSAAMAWCSCLRCSTRKRFVLCGTLVLLWYFSCCSSTLVVS